MSGRDDGAMQRQAESGSVGRSEPIPTGGVAELLAETTLADVLCHLEAATEASRKIDKALWCKLIFDPALDADPDGYSWMKIMGRPTPPYTASIDAALALVERVRPGWIVETLGEHYFADHRAKGPWRCTLRSNPNLPCLTYAQCHYARTAPLAVLAALLRSLLADDTTGRCMTKEPSKDLP